VVNFSPDTLLTAGTAFLVVALGTLSLALLWEWGMEQWRRRGVRRQLESIRHSESELASGELLRAQRSARMEPLMAVARRVPRLGSVETRLKQANLTWSFGTYLLVSAGGGVGATLVVFIVTGRVVPALLAGCFGLLAPYLHIARASKARLNSFEERLPEALELLSRAVRAGNPIASGIKIVADEAGEPIASEFQRAFEEQRFGLPFEDALLALGRRVPLVDMRMAITAILIQREVGGNLAEVLDTLADVIRQRFTMRRQLRVHTAQGRMSGYVLAALPMVVAGIIYLINPQYIGLLTTHPLGRLMLGMAISLQLVGFLWIRRIVSLDM
jgi:tight adherence protein B